MASCVVGFSTLRSLDATAGEACASSDLCLLPMTIVPGTFGAGVTVGDAAKSAVGLSPVSSSSVRTEAELRPEMTTCKDITIKECISSVSGYAYVHGLADISAGDVQPRSSASGRVNESRCSSRLGRAGISKRCSDGEQKE